MSNRIFLLLIALLITALSIGCKRERSKQINLNYSITIYSDLDSTLVRANFFESEPTTFLNPPIYTDIEIDSDVRFNETMLKFEDGIYSSAISNEIQNGIFDFSFRGKNYSHQIPTFNRSEPFDSVYIVRNNEEIEIPWNGPPLEVGEQIFIDDGIPGNRSPMNNQVGEKSVKVSGKSYNFTSEVRFQRSIHGEIESNKDLNTNYQTSFRSKPFTIQYIP